MQSDTLTLKKAIIYEGYKANHNEDRWIRESPSGHQTIVAIAQASDSLPVALALVNEGVELIELCGYIPLIWRVKIIEAIGNRAKVSSVAFGIESLFLATSFSKSYEEGNPPKEAYIILESGADPAIDRFEKTFDFQKTTFIPVPDESTGAEIASELAESGYGLIELYGGFSASGAAKVIDAVSGRVAVGVGSFTIDSINL